MFDFLLHIPLYELLKSYIPSENIVEIMILYAIDNWEYMEKPSSITSVFYAYTPCNIHVDLGPPGIQIILKQNRKAWIRAHEKH